jgi:uncharacterized protein YigE (DUF2233 family)
MRILILVSFVALIGCDARDVAAPVAASAPEPSRCKNEWQPVANGIEYRALNCSGQRFDLHLVRVDPQTAAVEAKVQSGGVEEVAGDAAFALNANFFDENLRTLGVVRSGGKTLNPLHPVEWQSVFSIDKDGKAGIVPVPEWETISDRADVAVQAGPRLVVGGQKNKVAQAQPDLRSGVCIQGDGRVVFFATPLQALFDVWQMVDLAHRSETDGGMACKEAMLFDGGPSVQILVRLSDGPISMEGDERVPAFILGRAR